MVNEVEQFIDGQIAEADGTAALAFSDVRGKPKEPSYKVGMDTKVPVSKASGKLWRQRITGAQKNREARGIADAWDEAVRYFNNNQATGDRDPNAQHNTARKRTQYIDTTAFAETENIIFANISAMVPHIYAKNPTLEITPTDKQNEELEDWIKAAERLGKTLAIREATPGINLKPKAKRACVNSLLTNSGWIEIGYTQKDVSSEAAYEELQTLAAEYEKAKTAKQIEEVEGKIQALEQKAFVLEPPGPWCKFRRPGQVVTDSDAEQDDGCDGKWMAVYEFMQTTLLNAVYTNKKGKNDRVLRYAPTHVLRNAVEKDAGHSDDIFTEIGENEVENEHKKYGYDSDEEYRAAQRTKVWRIYDKTTRRLLLYADNDWTWPIWVWDDPLRLDRFFPLYRLVFHTSPNPGDCKGEVTYVLDQQDAINEINHEERLARHWVRKNVFFDTRSGVTAKDVESVLSGPVGTAKGIAVPEGKRGPDLVWSIPPPSMNYPQLFDKSQKLAAIDRIMSSSEVMRGGQFKTNTTNEAIGAYAQVQAGRIDEFTDAVEDFIGKVLWGVLQLCIQYMDQETVTSLIGSAGAAWMNMSPQEISANLSVQVVGGSSVKPTSAAKKEEALKMGQVLGQFASAAPMAVIMTLRVLQRAFDELTMTDEDWDLILQSIGQGAGPGGQQNGPPDGKGASTEVLNQVSQMIDQLPPEMKRAFGEALANGVPVQDALNEIVSQIDAAQQQQQPAPQ